MTVGVHVAEHERVTCSARASRLTGVPGAEAAASVAEEHAERVFAAVGGHDVEPPILA